MFELYLLYFPRISNSGLICYIVVDLWHRNRILLCVIRLLCGYVLFHGSPFFLVRYGLTLCLFWMCEASLKSSDGEMWPPLLPSESGGGEQSKYLWLPLRRLTQDSMWSGVRSYFNISRAVRPSRARVLRSWFKCILFWVREGLSVLPIFVFIFNAWRYKINTYQDTAVH